MASVFHKMQWASTRYLDSGIASTNSKGSDEHTSIRAYALSPELASQRSQSLLIEKGPGHNLKHILTWVAVTV